MNIYIKCLTWCQAHNRRPISSPFNIKMKSRKRRRGGGNEGAEGEGRKGEGNKLFSLRFPEQRYSNTAMHGTRFDQEGTKEEEQAHHPERWAEFLLGRTI